MPEDESDDSDAQSVSMSSDEDPTPRTKKAAPQPMGQSPVDVEGKIKLAVAKYEKRMADMELGLAEIKDSMDKFKDMDSTVLTNLSELPDLKQRVEDLEDLVMVENAGIEELKGIMEDIRNRTQGEVAAAPQPAEGSEEMKSKMALVDELQQKISEIDEMRMHMDEMTHEIASMKEMAMSGPSSTLQSGNAQLFSAKLENLKSVVDELIKRKVELDIKIEKLDKNMSFLQTRGSDSIPEGLKKEIDTLNRNFSVIDSRMDAIESVSKNISEELQRVRVSAQKFDSFEKASNLVKELQGKLEEFKFIENEVKRVSNRVEGFYENIDQRLDKMREFERIIPEMKQSFETMREELGRKMDENKVQLLDRATKDETSSLRDRLSQVESKMSDTHLQDVEQEMDKLRTQVKNAVASANEPLNVVNIEISDLMGRLVALETRLGNLERMMQNAGKMQPIVLE